MERTICVTTNNVQENRYANRRKEGRKEGRKAGREGREGKRKERKGRVGKEGREGRERKERTILQYQQPIIVKLTTLINRPDCFICMLCLLKP